LLQTLKLIHFTNDTIYSQFSDEGDMVVLKSGARVVVYGTKP
jgi:hypothetical protein